MPLTAVINALLPLFTLGSLGILLTQRHRPEFVRTAVLYLFLDTCALCLLEYGSSLNLHADPRYWSLADGWPFLASTLSAQSVDPNVVAKSNPMYWLLSVGTTTFVTFSQAVLRSASLHVAIRPQSRLILRALGYAAGAYVTFIANYITYNSFALPIPNESAALLIICCAFIDVKLLAFLAVDALRAINMVFAVAGRATERATEVPVVAGILRQFAGTIIAFVTLIAVLAFTSPVYLESKEFAIHTNQLLIPWLTAPLLLILFNIHRLSFWRSAIIFFLVDTFALCLVFYGSTVNLSTQPSRLAMSNDVILTLPFSCADVDPGSLVPKSSAEYWLYLVVTLSAFITLPDAIINAAQQQAGSGLINKAVLTVTSFVKVGVCLFAILITFSSLTVGTPQNVVALLIGFGLIVVMPFHDMRADVDAGLGGLLTIPRLLRAILDWRFPKG